MSTDIVTAARPMSVPVGQEVDALARIASNLAEAGIYRKTAKNPAEVFAVLLAARDMGVSATAALAGGIHMVDGKPEISANLQAQLLREYRGPENQRYDFRILTPARERSKECHIEFRRREPGEPWETIGEEFFDLEDAKRAGLAGKQVWKAYPKMMLLARCLSDGIASHCPETARGLRVYGEGEIGGQEPTPPAAETTAPAPATAPVPEPDVPLAEVVQQPARITAERAEEINGLIREAIDAGFLDGPNLSLIFTSAGVHPEKVDRAAVAALTAPQADEIAGAISDLLPALNADEVAA